MHSDRSQISKWEHGKVEMSKPYELLLREMVASGKKIEDYQRHEAAKKKHLKHATSCCTSRKKSGRKQCEQGILKLYNFAVIGDDE
jgi:hypothetical protein